MIKSDIFCFCVLCIHHPDGLMLSFHVKDDCFMFKSSSTVTVEGYQQIVTQHIDIVPEVIVMYIISYHIIAEVSSRIRIF